MPTRYINITGRVNDVNTVRLPNDFTQSTKDKYIIIKKVRLINNNGQLDIGCALWATIFRSKIIKTTKNKN